VRAREHACVCVSISSFGRIIRQEVVLGVEGGAGATQGVLDHMRTFGNRSRRSVADGYARVPEVFTAAKLKGLVAGVIIPELREPADGPEQPQELAVDPP